MKAVMDITLRYEYDLDPTLYPEGYTPLQMVALDANNISSPDVLCEIIACHDLKVTVKGHVKD